MYYCNHEGWGKSFTNKHSLKRHKTTHDPNKKYKCDTCGKKFALPQYLKEHQVVHTGERPFICKFPGCGKSFRQAGKLSIHRKEHQDTERCSVREDKSYTLSHGLIVPSVDYHAHWLTQNLSETWNFANDVMQTYCFCDLPKIHNALVDMLRPQGMRGEIPPSPTLPISNSLELPDPLEGFYYPNVPY